MPMEEDVDALRDALAAAEEQLERALAESGPPARPRSASYYRDAIAAHGKFDSASKALRKLQGSIDPDVYEGLRLRLLAAMKRLMEEVFQIDPDEVEAMLSADKRPRTADQLTRAELGKQLAEIAAELDGLDDDEALPASVVRARRLARLEILPEEG